MVADMPQTDECPVQVFAAVGSARVSLSRRAPKRLSQPAGGAEKVDRNAVLLSAGHLAFRTALL